MKKIEATIRPSLFQDAKDSLQTLGVNVMTISRVEAFGRQKPAQKFYRSMDSFGDSAAKVKLEIVVDDAIAAHVRDVLLRLGRAANHSEVSVLVFNIEDAINGSASNGSTSNESIAMNLELGVHHKKSCGPDELARMQKIA